MSQGPKEIFAYEFHNRRHWNSRELECASWGGLEPVRYVSGDIANNYKALLEKVYENGCWEPAVDEGLFNVCMYCCCDDDKRHDSNCSWLEICKVLGKEV